MSSIGRTPNYDLPRFLRGSVPQWTGDVGPAFDKIDEVLFAQGSEIAGALNRVEQMYTNLQAGLERIAQAERTANEAKESVDATAGEVAHVKTDINLLSTWKDNTESRLNTQIQPPLELAVKHIDNLHDWLQYENMLKSIVIIGRNITIPANTAAHIVVNITDSIPGFRMLTPNAVYGSDNRVALSGYSWRFTPPTFDYFYNNTSNVQISNFTLTVHMVVFNNGLVWSEDLPSEITDRKNNIAAIFQVFDENGSVIQEGDCICEIND